MKTILVVMLLLLVALPVLALLGKGLSLLLGDLPRTNPALAAAIVVGLILLTMIGWRYGVPHHRWR